MNIAISGSIVLHKDISRSADGHRKLRPATSALAQVMSADQTVRRGAEPSLSEAPLDTVHETQEPRCTLSAMWTF